MCLEHFSIRLAKELVRNKAVRFESQSTQTEVALRTLFSFVTYSFADHDTARSVLETNVHAAFCLRFQHERRIDAGPVPGRAA